MAVGERVALCVADDVFVDDLVSAAVRVVVFVERAVCVVDFVTVTVRELVFVGAGVDVDDLVGAAECVGVAALRVGDGVAGAAVIVAPPDGHAAAMSVAATVRRRALQGDSSTYHGPAPLPHGTGGAARVRSVWFAPSKPNALQTAAPIAPSRGSGSDTATDAGLAPLFVSTTTNAPLPVSS